MKFKKTLLSLGTVAAVATPIASVVACGTATEVKQGGIFTEYVRAHDLVLSLGVAPQYHARSDIMSTHGLTDEGYLNDFSDDEKTKNGKRYNGGDREYFSSLGLGAYIARSITDSKGYFTDVKNKFDVKNSDADWTKSGDFHLNWKLELTKLGGEFDTLTSSTDYSTRATEVLNKWQTREDKLKADATAKKGTEKTVLLVRGNDDENIIYDQIIGESEASELYGLDGISMPVPTDSKLVKNYDAKSSTYTGADSKTGKADLKNAFSKTADIVVYLKTPNSSVTEDAAKTAMQPFLKDGGKVVMGSYDGWYLPFRGAAIGANIVMDNIEKDILGNPVDSSWKDEFSTSDLKTIWTK